MKRSDFGRDFLWGAASASYQIEGAYNEDGKGESVWDRFTHTPGKIHDGTTGDVACNHYHLFEKDLDIMKEMRLPLYRFSIGWPRIFPTGSGAKNQKGVDFYHRLIDGCLSRGIEPAVTLYHWDLPQALEDRGGWTSRETYERFCEYVDFATKEYGSKIKRWMILNEPFAFTTLGYMLGQHAPGRKGPSNYLPAVHHTALAQGEGGRIAKANCPNAEVGTTYSCSWIEPAGSFSAQAAARYDYLMNRMFVETGLGLGYNTKLLPLLKKMDAFQKEGDEKRMKFDFDFIGIQNYSREIIRWSPLIPYVWGSMIPAKKRCPKTTDMGWEIYPDGIYHLLKQFASYKGVKKIYVTENGAAFPDVVTGDRVHDAERTQFIQDYLGAVLRAKNEGVNVQGYVIWSFTDNFEWAEGYRPRFGLVHVDYETQKRTVKDSGLWFRDFLAGK